MEQNNRLLFEPSDRELIKIFNILENSHSVINENRCCFVFVYGKQPKSKFEEIELLDGVELMSIEFYGPKILKVFSFIISGYSGLIKLNKSDNIGEILKNLSDLSMVGLFSFDSKFENSFVKYYFQSNYRSYDPEKFLKDDLSHFSFILDGDNLETQSGLVAITQFGKECPRDLIEIYKNYGSYGYIGENKL